MSADLAYLIQMDLRNEIRAVIMPWSSIECQAIMKIEDIKITHEPTV